MLTSFGVKFAAKCVKKFYEKSVTQQITNNWYEGQITNGKADRLKILTVTESQGLQDYTPGTALSLGVVTDSEAALVPDQRKGYYFEIDDVNRFESYVDDVKPNILDQKINTLWETIDAYILGLYSDVASGNQIGTDWDTGTVAVTVTTGAVAGTTTGFDGSGLAAALVGRGFKATGHTSWYRIKTYTNATTIVIEDDSDDESTGYTGGAISGGAAYEIAAATKFQVSATTIYGKVVDMKTKLDQAKAPKEDRWLVVEASIAGLLLQSTQLTAAVPKAYEQVIEKGEIGYIAGFKVFQSEQISGNNSDGFRILAGHISWMTFAQAFVASTIEEDLPGEFGRAYKGLNCYGGKVIDERRKMATEFFCYI